MKKNEMYEAPEVKVVEVEVEQGFAVSGGLKSFNYGGHFDDDDE